MIAKGKVSPCVWIALKSQVFLQFLRFRLSFANYQLYGQLDSYVFRSTYRKNLYMFLPCFASFIQAFLTPFQSLVCSRLEVWFPSIKIWSYYHFSFLHSPLLISERFCFFFFIKKIICLIRQAYHYPLKDRFKMDVWEICLFLDMHFI